MFTFPNRRIIVLIIKHPLGYPGFLNAFYVQSIEKIDYTINSR